MRNMKIQRPNQRPAMGRPNPYQNPTPAAKGVHVADKFGLQRLTENQGSTVEIFDYVKVATGAAPQKVEFFTALNSKSYPYTNLQQNQLQAGEMLIFTHIFITCWTVTSDTNYNANAATVSYQPLALVTGAAMGLLNVQLDNNRVIKNNSLARCTSNFNKVGKTSINNIFELENPITLIPQVSITAVIDLPAITMPAAAGQQSYIGIHLTGPGAILNMKQNV